MIHPEGPAAYAPRMPSASLRGRLNPLIERIKSYAQVSPYEMQGAVDKLVCGVDNYTV
jgi:hypothetical protein